VKQRFPTTTKELNPVPPFTFQSTFGVAGHVAAIRSGVLPSPFGPRYCGQSVASSVVENAMNGRKEGMRMAAGATGPGSKSQSVSHAEVTEIKINSRIIGSPLDRK
jgi:hypothetical protein